MKKIKPLVAAFGLSTVLTLTGCGDTGKVVCVGESAYRWASKIYYDDSEINGTISYDNLEKGFLCIVTLELNGKSLEPKLMAINFHEFHPTRGAWNDTLSYVDLESGITQIEYHYPGGYTEGAIPEIQVGSNFEIIDEKNLFDFIIEENWLQDEYEINELIEFYNEKVNLTMETEEINNLALIPKFGQNI